MIISKQESGSNSTRSHGLLSHQESGKRKSQLVTILQMYNLSALIALGLLTCRGRNRAQVAFEVWSIIGSWPWSIHPLFQLILGWKAANHG
jgi:hypothetical protein